MSVPLIGFFVAVAVVAGIYFLFVVPGERDYHATKLRLMQERIARHEDRQRQQEDEEQDGAASTDRNDV